MERTQQGFKFRIRAPRDFWGGIALMVLALIAIWASGDLSGMRGFAFGPGTAPRLFAMLLLVCGAGVALTGLFIDGPAIERYKVRGPLLIMLAILTFAGTIRPLGMIVASYLTWVIAITASVEMRWLESLIAAAVMTAFCVGVFVYLLQLPFQLLPAFLN